MRKMRLPIAITIAATGCTTANAPPQVEPPARQLEGECDASAVQNHLGHRATADVGSQLLEMTGARQLRWVPPRTAVTMDYRADRLSVTYDDDMKIVTIACG
ncbi:MAG: I78 family peptidase inhibitor [Alteraurantiacibacter sp. bin_em_oilr2.035]|nr:I78 family peptidase inhibitor [Alteraurantiacibacter sp. bin_em_oilr2.035]